MIFFVFSGLKELQQTYQLLVLDVQGVIELQLHLQQPSLSTTPPLEQTTSTSTEFLSNLKVKTCGRSNTNLTPDEITQLQAQRERSSQYKEMASSFCGLHTQLEVSDFVGMCRVTDRAGWWWW